MKIVLLLALVVALCHGYTRNCYGYKVYNEFWYNDGQSRLVTSCRKPTESLVQLNVPEGFDYVYPSVVKINQCSGAICSAYQKKCVAVRSIPRKVQVEAFTRGNRTHKCVDVSVKEHTECGCICDRTNCETKKVVDDETCSCVCDPRLKSKCYARMAKNDEVRWSDRACACLCIHRIDCGSSMEWNHWSCRCDPRQ